jgi:transcriptional regulator with XRE-family HTH domain
MIIMNSNREWLRKKAEQEDGCYVSVGGLLDDVTRVETRPEAFEVTRHAFIRLLQLARRAKGLTREELAQEADVETEDIANIETKPGYVPTPRTVYKIAQYLKVPEKKLMALSGLVQLKDPQFNRVAIRFAAHSERVEKLTGEERQALEEFVKFLNEK